MLLRTIRLCFFILIAMVVASCTVTPPEPEPVPAPPPEPVKTIVLSATPLANPSKREIRYAQTALNQLGYKVGAVDGAWGPRSAKAMLAFESAYDLLSANGSLSQLNLAKLSEFSVVQLNDIVIPEQTNSRRPALSKTVTESDAKIDGRAEETKTISSQNILESQSLSSGPKLIITDQAYTVLTKPNPFSGVLMKVPAGTGLYIKERQEDWYVIETLDRKSGYIERSIANN